MHPLIDSMRRFSSFIASAMMCCFWTLGWVGIVGCHQAKEISVADSPVTLTLSTWGSAQELSTLRQQLARFETENPHIRVNVSHIPESYLAKLHLMAVSNLLPDVMLMNSWQVPRFAAHHLLQPLTMPPQQTQAFFPTALESLRVQGQLMALPRDVSTLMVLVNKDILKRYGVPLPSHHWSINELERLSRQLLKRQRNQAYPPVSFYREPALYWLPWVWAEGGQLWDSKGCLALHQPTASKALARMMRWPSDGLAPQRKDSARTTMTQLFLQERLAFLVTGRWTVPLLREQSHFAWGVWPLPAGQAGSVTGVDATGYAISKATRYQHEARKLIDFLTSERVLRAQTASGLLVPARIHVANQSLANEPDFLRVLNGSLRLGQPTPSHPQWPEVETALAEALEPYWDTEVTPKQLSVALQPLSQRFCLLSQGKKS